MFLQNTPTTLRLRSLVTLRSSGTGIAAPVEATIHTSSIRSKVNSLKDGCGTIQRLDNATGHAATKGLITLRKHRLSSPGKNRPQTRIVQSGRVQMFMSRQQMLTPEIPYCVINEFQYIVDCPSGGGLS